MQHNLWIQLFLAILINGIFERKKLFYSISKMMSNDLKCNLSAYSAFKNTVQGYELNFFAFQATSFGPVMFVLVILLTSSLKRTRILEQSTLSLDSTEKKNVQVRDYLCMYEIEFAVQTSLKRRCSLQMQ